MAKVEMNPELPSKAIVRAANEPATVTDDLGRVIKIKKPKPLDNMRLFSIIGSENSKNEQYFGYAVLAFSVVEIDGDPVVQPQTLLQLEALVQRLDSEGLNAVAKGFAENFGKADSEDEIKEKVKN